MKAVLRYALVSKFFLTFLDSRLSLLASQP
nr:unnamed protein product [Callosobruchus chinensis]